MMTTVLNLFKALLNATLLLLALCLFLGWQLFASAHDLTQELEKISGTLTPMRHELQTMSQEFAELTDALNQSNAPDSTEMRLRLARLEEQLSGLRKESAALGDMPVQLTRTAVETSLRFLSEKFTAYLPQL